MITTKDNIILDDISEGRPKMVRLGKKMIRLRPLVNSVARKMDRYVAEAELHYSEDKSQLIFNMNNNRSLAPKCLSLMILHSWFKVTFFHWIHWRYIDTHYSQQEMKEPLSEGFGMGELQALYINLLCLQDNSQMIQKATKAIIRSTPVAQNLAQETAS